MKFPFSNSKKRKIALQTLFFVTAVLFGVACNQVGLGALTAARNAVMLPIDGISGVISNQRYNTIEERTHGTQIEFLAVADQSTRCDPGVDQSTLEIPSEITDIMQATRDSACSCGPWGSCSQTHCSCSELCPDDFSIFQRPPQTDSLRDLSVEENSLSFRNVDSMELSSIEGTNGYCWGHASLTSQFNRLASFDGDDLEMRNKLDSAPGSEQRLEALTFYKQAIDTIAENQVANFPGFPNLSELSEHPDLQSYIADKVARAWADRAMSFQALRTALGTTAMTRSNSESLLEQVVQKIDNHQQPQIIFTSEGEVGQTHAVLVSHYQRTDDGVILCLRDSNYRPFTNEQCVNQMVLNDDGGLSYGPWGRLGRVALTHNDNADALEQFHSLKEECNRIKGCE